MTRWPAAGIASYAEHSPWLPYVALALSMTFLGGSVVLGRAIRADIPAYWEEFEGHILYAYERSMRQYLADRSRIPPGHLTEVRFEDLETRPLHELERVYADLSLPSWEWAKGHFTEYLGPRATYRKNRYRLDQAAIDRVDARWRFAVDAWSYTPPETG